MFSPSRSDSPHPTTLSVHIFHLQTSCVDLFELHGFLMYMTLQSYGFVLEGAPVTMPQTQDLTFNTLHQKFGSVETSRQNQDSLLSFGTDHAWKWTIKAFSNMVKVQHCALPKKNILAN